MKDYMDTADMDAEETADIAKNLRGKGALKEKSAGADLAVGGAMKVVSMVSQRRMAERQARAKAENDRNTKLVSAMSRLGDGVGSVGMA